ncbi:MAG: hypothetical protein U0L11_00560 [Acutalibacteraceae bacterium]|nr:hypothetical protein [Acutalibacteraceae bacterium]
MNMNIPLSFLIRTLAVINAFLPLCKAICRCFGYEFTLFNYTVCAVIFTVVSVFCVIGSSITKEKIIKKSDTAMLTFLPLFSVINWVVYLFKSSDKVIVTICMLICFVCTAIMAIKHIRPIFLKIISIFTPSLALFPIALLSFLLLLPFGRNTVVKTIPSPEGTYYAEVTDSNQGALGGDTLVHIHKSKKLDFLLFDITKTPERIYTGDWKEYETMQIHWKNEHCLVIDEIEYSIE